MLVNICEKVYYLVRCFPEKTSSAETTSVPKILHYFVISHKQYPDLLPMHVRGDILKENQIIREKILTVLLLILLLLYFPPQPLGFLQDNAQLL